MFFPDTGMPIWKMARIRTRVGGLAAGTVYGRDLNAEIVDNGPARVRDQTRLRPGKPLIVDI